MEPLRYRRLLTRLIMLTGFQVVSVTFGQPLSDIAPGAQLVLKRPLTFSAGESRVYFQDGEPISLSTLSLWRPSCYLRRSEPFDTTYAAEPNSFTIVHVQKGIDDEWGQGAVAFWTEIDLGSVRQGMHSLRCEIWTDKTVNDAFVTEAEFVSIVGSWMYFLQPGQGTLRNN